MFGISLRSCLWAFFSLFVVSFFVLAQEPNEALLQRYSQEAQAAMVAKRYSDAERAYEKLIQLDPGVGELYSNLGLAYFQQRKYEKAVPAFQKALKLKPGLSNAAYFLAMSESELGHNKQALPALEKGFNQTRNAMLKRMLGLYLERTFTGLHRDKDAVAVALQLSQLFPNDPEVLYQTGRLCGNMAFVSMQRLQQVAPASLWRHLASGDLFESQGDYALAIREYRRVLALDPHRPGIHFRLGRALLQLKKPDSRAQALKEFQQELKVDPTNARAAYEAGEINRQSGQFSEAHALFTEALKYYPNFEEAQVGLGRVLLNEKKPAQAVTLLQKAVSLDPKDDVAYFQLARAYRELGNSVEQKEAMAAFQLIQAGKAAHEQKLAVGAYSEDSVTKQKLDSPKGP
jgi:tetratricopeptide (TPR) repeat protein